MNLIIGGDVIACKNKALKSFVLFPRCDRDIQIDVDIDIEKEGRKETHGRWTGDSERRCDR